MESFRETILVKWRNARLSDRLAISAIAISILSLIASFSFNYYMYIRDDFSTTAYIELADFDSDKNELGYDVTVINSGNRTVALERIRQFYIASDKKHSSKESDSMTPQVIKPGGVISRRFKQSFTKERKGQRINYGIEFNLIDSNGLTHVSDVVFGKMNVGNAKEFEMHSVKVNLITNKASNRVFSGPKYENNLLK
jgi:hypothetical protein